MRRSTRLLIVGYGDIACRLAPLLTEKFRVFGLIRDATDRTHLRASGVRAIVGDLDNRASLSRLAGLADIVVHLAPPQGSGTLDLRSKHLTCALGTPGRHERRMLPHRLIYISTTGVYGNCTGDEAREERRANPQTARAKRRLAAERELRIWGQRTGVAVSILRVPGIYAADRLPLERLRANTPALAHADDPHTNHIHADDLARIVATAMFRMQAGRVYNCVDDSRLRMGEYFDLVADHFSLPHPPRISLRAAEYLLAESSLGFMRESRRVTNFRMKKELRVKLRYPTVGAALAAIGIQDSRLNSPSIAPRRSG